LKLIKTNFTRIGTRITIFLKEDPELRRVLIYVLEKKPEVLHKSKKPPNTGICVLYSQNTYTKTKKMIVTKEEAQIKASSGTLNQHPPAHIHWISVITQLWMNLN
jgi:hypothetical protein